MAAFVDGQEHFLHVLQHSEDHVSENQPYTTSGRMRKGKDIDLGPLVGSMRGFRTKERVPMSGGMGGMEMCGDEADEVPVVTVRVPSPQKRNGKGKERAVERDVDILDVEERRGRLREAKGICLFSFICFVVFVLFCLRLSLTSSSFFFYDDRSFFCLQDHETLRNHRSATRIYPRRLPLRHILGDLSQHQERSYPRSCGPQIPSPHLRPRMSYRRRSEKTECHRRCARGGCIANWRQ
jgi:hypothetical protein